MINRPWENGGLFYIWTIVSALLQPFQPSSCVYKKVVSSCMDKEPLTALDQPICLLNKYSFVCQEHEINCHQVLHALGFQVLHQNSVECTQDDSIHTG